MAVLGHPVPPWPEPSFSHLDFLQKGLWLFPPKCETLPFVLGTPEARRTKRSILGIANSHSCPGQGLAPGLVWGLRRPWGPGTGAPCVQVRTPGPTA